MQMGADCFEATVSGETAEVAFGAAVEHALYEYGHRGYTGTIAEKHGYTLIDTVQTYDDANALRKKLMDADDERINDKWGPAGCIAFKEPPKGVAPGKPGNKWFLFFGWASC